MIQINGLANLPRWRGEDPVEHIVRRTRESERRGFDLVSFSDWVVGDPFPPLVLLAQQTQRVSLMTRITCAYNRSPVLLASAAAWIDRISNGRFLLGIGASLEWEAGGVHGEPFAHPAPRMADIVTIMRGLWGEDLPGIERHSDGSISYAGRVVSVRRSRVDLLPSRRIPILLAAAGPHMLRVAGALCDGVILERTSLRYLDWAWEQLRLGAASSGRSLAGFEVCIQGSLILDPDGSGQSPAARQSIQSHIDYCHYPEWQRTHQAMGLGDAAEAVRQAIARGDRARAEAIVRERFWPEMAVRFGPGNVGPLFAWIAALKARGLTILALPLEIEEMTGLSLAEIRAAINA